MFTGKHLCQSLFLMKFQTFRAATLLKETPTQVFSCEYCKISKNTDFEEHLRTASSVWRLLTPSVAWQSFPWKVWVLVNLGKTRFYALTQKTYKIMMKSNSFNSQASLPIIIVSMGLSKVYLEPSRTSTTELFCENS